MEWRDEGILLAVRHHGEHAAILEVFTPSQGRHRGVLRGGQSRKWSALLQIGAQLDVTWRARLEAHLGTYRVEPLRNRAAGALADPVRLAGLSAVCALLTFALPEREPQRRLYDHSCTLLDGLDAERWPLAYLHWELMLLSDLGFGLDLSRCAVTGVREGLRYISPKTGRAVTDAAAGRYADRLLPLSPALLGQSVTSTDVLTGLAATGHFLAHHLAPALGDRPLPAVRQRLLDLLLHARQDPEEAPERQPKA